jgi:hypothetical protein
MLYPVPDLDPDPKPRVMDPALQHCWDLLIYFCLININMLKISFLRILKLTYYRSLVIRAIGHLFSLLISGGTGMFH